MTAEAGPEQYLTLEQETKFGDLEGGNSDIVFAITCIDLANINLQGEPNFAANDSNWWELSHAFDALIFSLDSASDPATSIDPDLLSLAQKVADETRPRVDAFWDWISEQGPEYMFGDNAEILRLMS